MPGIGIGGGGGGGGGASGSFEPVTLGSNLGLLLDPTQPASMTFRPVRTAVAANSQGWISNGHPAALAFPGDGTHSQFFISFWMRINVASGGLTSGAVIMGVYGSGGNMFTLNFGTNGTYHTLSWTVFNASGAYQGGSNFTGTFNGYALPTGGAGDDGFQWVHVVMQYDGAQSGNASILKLYVNNQLQTTFGSPSLPVKFFQTTPTFYLAQGNSGNYCDISICDLVLCGGLAGTVANAVSDVWNGGFGRRFPDWPASCPTPFAWYKCDDNYSDAGVAPSGDMVDSWTDAPALSSTYLLKGQGSPGGNLQVIDWRELSPNGAVYKFGFNPITGKRNRNLEAEWSPTSRGGLPGVSCFNTRSSGSSYVVQPAWAYAAVNATAFGATGHIYCNAMEQGTIATSAALLSFSDDKQGLGSGNSYRRSIAVTTFGDQNGQLANAGHRTFLSVQFQNINAGASTTGPADLEGWNGNETIGIPFHCFIIQSIDNTGPGGICKITTATPHGFSAGAQVSIGIAPGNGTVEAGGDYTISNVTANSFTIPVSFVHAFTPGDGSTIGYPWVMLKSIADVTQPKANTVYSFECTNNGSGTWSLGAWDYAAGNYAPGPYEFIIGNQYSGVVMDDGFANNFPNAWFTYGVASNGAAPVINYTASVLNGIAEVQNGNWNVTNAGPGRVLGPMAVTKLLTIGQRASMRAWDLNT